MADPKTNPATGEKPDDTEDKTASPDLAAQIPPADPAGDAADRAQREPTIDRGPIPFPTKENHSPD